MIQMLLMLLTLAPGVSTDTPCPVIEPCACATWQPTVYTKNIVCDWSIVTGFPRFKYTGVTYDLIKLMYNQLDHIPPRAFRNVSAKRIHMRGNYFTKWIDPDAFSGLEQTIEQLDLSASHIESVHYRTFKGLHALNHLTLSQNRISILFFDLFSDLRDLRKLSLAQNTFMTLPETIFRSNSNLELLSLSYGRLNSLPHSVFKGLWRLKELDLRGNLISQLTRGLFTELHSLRLLQLCHNPIKLLGYNVFKGLKNLHKLELREGVLYQVTPHAFKDAQRLVHLSLEHNNLTSLTRDTLSLPHLKTLILQGNSLTTVPRDILQLPALRTLNLAFNRIRQIDLCWFAPFARLNRLNLRDNPLTCDCRLFWLRALERRLLRGRVLRPWDHAPLITGECHLPARLENIDSTSWHDEACLSPQFMEMSKCKHNH